MRRVRCREVLLEGMIAIAAGTAATQTADTAETRRVDAIRSFPVTDEMLRDPDPADWLMYSRTYDAQRFSPLDQIDTSNVSRLEKAWSKALPPGVIEVIPIVYRGVMYITTPGGGDGASGVWALDAATGELLWAYQPEGRVSTRLKALAIHGDTIFFTAPAPRNEPSPIVALDAATGEVRWRTEVTPEQHTAGAIVADG